MKKIQWLVIGFFVTICFLLGILVGPALKTSISQWQNPRIELSETGKKLSKLYQSINDTRINIAEMQKVCRSKEKDLAQQKEILQLAQKLTPATGTITIGLTPYTPEQVQEDIQNRQKMSAGLKQEIDQKKQRIAQYEEFQNSLFRFTELAEADMKRAGLEADIPKARLIALCVDPEIKEMTDKNQKADIQTRLDQAQKLFEEQLTQSEDDQELADIFPELIEWDTSVVADKDWLAQLKKSAEVKKIMDQALALQKEGGYDQALVLVDEALVVDPENREPLATKDQFITAKKARARPAAIKKAEEEKARLAAIKKAEEEKARKAAEITALFREVNSLRQKRDYNQAISVLDKILIIDSENREASAAKDKLAQLIAEEEEKTRLAAIKKAEEKKARLAAIEKAEQERIKEARAEYQEYMALGREAQPGFFDFTNTERLDGYERSLAYFQKAYQVAPTEMERLNAQKMITRTQEKIRQGEKFIQKQREAESRMEEGRRRWGR